jgi:small subunit ribosomal protein S20
MFVTIFCSLRKPIQKRREKIKKQLLFLYTDDKIQICTGNRVQFTFYTSEEVFGLPNIKSAEKRVLVNRTKQLQNKAARSALRTQLKKFDAVVAEGNRSEADIAYKAAVKAVDKAAAGGLLHKNNAAHKKSSMTLKLNQLEG